MDMLMDNLRSPHVKVLPLQEDDMKKYGDFLSLFYRKLPKIENLHLFSCDIASATDKKLEMVILESDLPGCKQFKFNAFKQGFEGRSQYPKGQAGLKEAIRNRKRLMAEEEIAIIQTAGINPYKQVEMHDNYRKNVPEQYWAVTCPEPSAEVLAMVRAEKDSRAEVKKLKEDQKKYILRQRRELDVTDSMKKKS